MVDNEIKRTLDRVLRKIKPSKKEVLKKRGIAQNLIGELNKQGFEAELVGSVARNTFISNDRDIDVFFFFDPKTSRDELEKKGLEIGKKILEKHGPRTHFAEHPYVRANVEGYDVEIVPCYRIKKGKIISAVDRTPLHNEYILKTLRESQKDEVRLLKQFLKAFDGYGADSKVKGFSGYLCEILIIAYGSFEKFLKNVANKWKIKMIVDIKKARDNYDKFKEPLVVIDPIDKERNVAAAVDRTVLSRFILKARQFLENPSGDFFFPIKKKIDLKKEIKGRNLLVVVFKCPKNVVEEIIWSQLEKLTKTIQNILYDNEFRVYKSTYWTDERKKCVILFELTSHDLDKYKKHTGPEIWDTGHVKAFIEKNPNHWISRSKFYAWKKREYRNAANLVSDVLRKEELIPSHLRKTLKRFKIRINEKAFKEKPILKKFFEV